MIYSKFCVHSVISLILGSLLLYGCKSSEHRTQTKDAIYQDAEKSHIQYYWGTVANVTMAATDASTATDTSTTIGKKFICQATCEGKIPANFSVDSTIVNQICITPPVIKAIPDCYAQRVSNRVPLLKVTSSLEKTSLTKEQATILGVAFDLASGVDAGAFQCVDSRFLQSDLDRVTSSCLASFEAKKAGTLSTVDLETLFSELQVVKEKNVQLEKQNTSYFEEQLKQQAKNAELVKQIEILKNDIAKSSAKKATEVKVEDNKKPNNACQKYGQKCGSYTPECCGDLVCGASGGFLVGYSCMLKADYRPYEWDNP